MNDQVSAGLPPAHPTFAEAAKVWARIGLLSFGGPAGQIALMHRELVEERRWISESRFLHALNYCMLLPGPEAQQLATYIGWLLHGTRGGVVAGTLFVMPGFFVILGLSSAYALFQETNWLASLFFGLKAAVLAIVIEALIRLSRRALKTGFDRWLAILAFLALFVFAVPFPLVVLAAGIAGYVAARHAPARRAAAHQAKAPDLPSVIGADYPHGKPSWGRAAAVIAVWGALWLAPFLLIAAIVGGPNVYTDIGLFFSQMAVVTFGGAYAVLAYVAQQAVETYHWLRPGEMVDGLALAETTPGPLVLVLAFVGFMGAYRAPIGVDALTSGVLGATLATWVTFVPCFLWIFLGAPYVERLRANAALSGALSAISAAVAGVILNLAVWFGLHVLFGRVERLESGPLSLPYPDPATLHPAALFLTVIAAVSLFWWKRGIFQTLAICAVAGWLLMLV
ncbi:MULTISPECIES: chromate efflux transporter [Sinorhizobium]|uniref:Chromate transporter n=2 Tax=Sinorhizobium TaxID=28105 RepID=A0A2S3YI74_9HYPH|nr:MULTISPECIES: chromate efflux transporter [Sinorhizobium]AUX75402.1 chromate transporter protein [Sinorhizobium fredii]PDT40846.1 chromate transporter [Sinorhizobium sp. FG01]PDT52646.1 chromate transporter [Sinorhizobium sp. NG07B]POH26441.1 chromate transporter [Sinorhizobium americanum]POH28372.1 chromate transporter [Sinorhizobium americanum]